MTNWFQGLFGGGEETDHESGEEADRGSGEETDRRGGEVWVWDRIDEYPFEHHSDASGRIKHLIQNGDHDEVEDLLLWCIEFAEAEAEYLAAQDRDLDIPAPWYYEQLANVYRLDDRHEHEIRILHRYIAICEELDQQPREELVERLEEARDIAASR